MTTLPHDTYVGDDGGTTPVTFRRGGRIYSLVGAIDVTLVAVPPEDGDALSWNTSTGMEFTDRPAGQATKTWAGDDLTEPSLEDRDGQEDEHYLCQLIASYSGRPAVYSDYFWLRVGSALDEPSGGAVTFEAGTAALINAEMLRLSALAGAPWTVFLGRHDARPTTIELEAKLRVPSNVILQELRGVELVATWEPDAADADDPTNCLIEAASELGDSALLDATAGQNAESIVLDEIPDDLVPGAWITIDGNNTTLGVGPPGQSNADSDGTGVHMWSTVQVSEDWDGVSLTVELATGLPRHHCVGSTVTVVTTVVRNAHVIGEGKHNCAGGTIAVGILLRGAVGCSVVGGQRPMRFEGFSRAAVDLDRGATDFVVRDVHGDGEINSLVYMDSATDGFVSDVSTSPDGLRFHAEGYPRAGILFRNRCVRIRGLSAHIVNMCQGLMMSGGEALIWDGLYCEDLDPDEMLTRGAVGGAGPEEFHAAESYCGVVLQGCFTPLEWVENAQGCELFNVRCGANIQTPTGSVGAAIMDIVNLYGFLGSDWSIVNRGSWTAAQSSQGIRWIDSTGTVDTISIRGVNQPLVTHGAPGLFTVSNGFVYAVPGAGSGGTTAMHLNHGLTVGSKYINIRFQGFGLTTTTVTYGADFADYAFELIDCWFDGVGLATIGRCFVGTNNSGIALDTGYLLQATGSTAGQRQFTRPTVTPGARVYGAALHPAGAGAVWILVQDLTRSAYVRCASGAVAHGDVLRPATDSFEASAADQDFPGTLAPWPACRSTGSKAAGAAGLLNTVGLA